MQLAASRASGRQCATAQRRSACQNVAPKPVARIVTQAASEDAAGSNGAITHANPAMVDFGELSDIIRMVHDTDIIELELKSKKFTLNLRKKEALAVEQPIVQYVNAPQGYSAPPPPPAAPAPAPAAAPAAAPASGPSTPAPAPRPPPPVKIEGIEIVSPMAGTFYASGAPGEAPFVKAGDRVKKGQVIGIVEAMKLMNEIEAEIGGEVVKVLLENGTPVSVGMPLMVIRP